jgi:hypothetical protein
MPLRPHIRIAAAGLGVLALGACSAGIFGPAVSGSGHVTSESRQVAGFDRVDLSGSGELTITQGATESLTVEADDNIRPVLTSEVSGRTLTLGTKNGTNIRPSRPVRYTVTMKTVHGIGVSGSGRANASGVSTDTLALDVSGSGSMGVSGSAARETVDISGSGRVRGTSLAARTAQVSVSGSGECDVNATDTLNVDISGSGTVRYTGSPSIHQTISGSGSISKL